MLTLGTRFLLEEWQKRRSFVSGQVRTLYSTSAQHIRCPYSKAGGASCCQTHGERESDKLFRVPTETLTQLCLARAKHLVLSSPLLTFPLMRRLNPTIVWSKRCLFRARRLKEAKRSGIGGCIPLLADVDSLNYRKIMVLLRCLDCKAR